MPPRVPAPRQCPVSALLHTRLTSECWKMGAKANLQTGSSEDINEVTGGPCTRPWPWSVPAVPCNKCNRLDSYCQHWRFCLGKVAACSSLLLGAKLLQLPVFSHDMIQPSQPKHVPHFLCSRVAPAVLDNPRHRGAAGSRVGLLLLSTAKFCRWVLQLHALQFRCQWWSGELRRTKRLVRAGTLEWRINEY